jgi:hypothetical protein
MNKFDGKNTTKILTLVSIIENHNSGRKSKTRLKSRFSPWIGELQLPENATRVVILKSRYKRDSVEKWWIPPQIQSRDWTGQRFSKSKYLVSA